MDKDFELKTRLNSIFWDLGFYTRLEVKLSGYSLETSTPMELTDLDVLGIKVHPDLSFEYLVGDCTTRKKVTDSPIQRVFWLKGVMDFFGGSKGYLCLGTKSQFQEVQRVVASDLGVSLLNDENLQNLEKRMSLHAHDLLISAPESWQYFEGNVSSLPKAISRILEYRKYNYWLTSRHDRIHSLISLVSNHKEFFEDKGKFIRALSLDLLALFSLAVLQMSSYGLRVNPEDPERILKSYFFGGYTEMKRREGIAENLRKIITSGSRQQELFKTNDMNERLRLEPKYLPMLFDTAYRLLNKPYDSSQIPRYIQSVLFEKTLYGDKNSKGIEYIKSGFSDVAIKLSRDLAKLFSEATGIPQAIFSDL